MKTYYFVRLGEGTVAVYSLDRVHCKLLSVSKYTSTTKHPIEIHSWESLDEALKDLSINIIKEGKTLNYDFIFRNRDCVILILDKIDNLIEDYPELFV